MNLYTKENLPKRGTAKRLWRVLTEYGFDIDQLSFNPNCWGKRNPNAYWGTWALTYIEHGEKQYWICGVNENNAVWVSTTEVMTPRVIIPDLKLPLDK